MPYSSKGGGMKRKKEEARVLNHMVGSDSQLATLQSGGFNVPSPGGPNNGPTFFSTPPTTRRCNP